MSGAWRVPFVISVDPWDTNGTTPLAQPKKIILTNAQTPIFEWTCAFDESLWDDSLIMVMVLGLSARLAIALTSNIQLAQVKMQSANGMIEAARANDGNEGFNGSRSHARLAYSPRGVLVQFWLRLLLSLTARCLVSRNG
jgi:hypothetical protein